MTKQLGFLLPLLLTLSLCTCDRAPDSGDVTDRQIRKAEAEENVQAAVDRASNITPSDDPNPPAEGFDLAGSDRKAVQVADSIMKYYGGRNAWDRTRYLRWNFLGRRTLNWDKHEGRVRIDVPSENTVYLLNYAGDTLAGRVQVGGREIIDPAERAAALQKAHSIFINDSYWLVHQFKLKDSGVTLKWGGDVNTDPEVGRPSYVLEQTFDGVGETPSNKYRLFVDKVTFRINTWQFFRDATDEEPTLQTPWKGHIPYRGILLSGDRGDGFQLTDIGVAETRREQIFTEF